MAVEAASRASRKRWRVQWFDVFETSFMLSEPVDETTNATRVVPGDTELFFSALTRAYYSRPMLLSMDFIKLPAAALWNCAEALGTTAPNAIKASVPITHFIDLTSIRRNSVLFSRVSRSEIRPLQPLEDGNIALILSGWTGKSNDNRPARFPWIE